MMLMPLLLLWACFAKPDIIIAHKAHRCTRSDDCLSSSVVLKAVSLPSNKWCTENVKATCGHSSIACVNDFACSSMSVKSENEPFHISQKIKIKILISFPYNA